MRSSDCGGDNFCLGAVGHCGQDCSQGQACPTGTTCSPISGGKVILGQQCLPDAAVCDVSSRPQLSCGDTWAGFADGFFGSYCRSCHRHETSFTNGPDVMLGAAGIRLALERGSMPPSSELQPSPAELQRLFEWLACGQATPSAVR